METERGEGEREGERDREGEIGRERERVGDRERGGREGGSLGGRGGGAERELQLENLILQRLQFRFIQNLTTNAC